MQSKQTNNKLIIAAAGSGKTTVVNKILESLDQKKITVIPQDSYYKDNSHLPLEQRQELQAVTQGFAPATVLKVAHHGARTSSSPQFLQMAKPQYAVISVGANNRFGHPHNDVLQRLAGSGTKVYRTDLQGAILFKSDGRQLTVTPFKP